MQVLLIRQHAGSSPLMLKPLSEQIWRDKRLNDKIMQQNWKGAGHVDCADTILNRINNRLRTAHLRQKMFKPDVSVDELNVKGVERRKAAEAARQARIFNTRHRVMGLDLDALNKQVEEKKRREDFERQRDKAFDILKWKEDEEQVKIDIKERQEQAALQADLVKFWATYQRKEDSRDGNLQSGLKGAFNHTIPENELGPSSMHIFQGEDAGEKQRKREQKKMEEKDLKVQGEENERRRMREKHRDLIANLEMVHQDLRGIREDALEEECKKAARIALDNYNQVLAAEQAEKLKEQQRREAQENLTEIWHTLTSDMMTERGKGVSPEQLSAIKKEWDEQRSERQRQREAEKMQDAAWYFHMLKTSREDEDESRLAGMREKRILMNQFNEQLAREQQAHQQYLNTKVYINKPTKDFFDQFNNSSR